MRFLPAGLLAVALAIILLILPVTAAMVSNADTPAPSTVSGTGTLILTSIPVESGVYLDGTFIGFTPLEIRTATAGTHRVVFTYPGYENATFEVTVMAGQESRVDGTLVEKGIQATVTEYQVPGFSLIPALAALAFLAIARIRK